MSTFVKEFRALYPDTYCQDVDGWEHWQEGREETLGIIAQESSKSVLVGRSIGLDQIKPALFKFDVLVIIIVQTPAQYIERMGGIPNPIPKNFQEAAVWEAGRKFLNFANDNQFSHPRMNVKVRMMRADYSTWAEIEFQTCKFLGVDLNV